MTKKSAFNILRIGISIGLILFLFWLMRGSLDDVFLAIKKIDKAILAVGFLFCILAFLLLSMRLKFIMAAQRINIANKDIISLTFIGQFFSNFLPTSIGGDLVKAYYASRTTGKNLSSIASIIFDRLLGTLTFILMALIACIFVKGVFYNRLVIMFLCITLLISLAVGLILFSRKIARRVPFLGWVFRMFNLEERMKSVYEIIYNYKHHPGLILNAVLMSFALQALMFYVIYIIIKGLNFYIPLKMVFLFMPIINTISMAPSINGLGVREGAFVLLFGPLMTKEGAFALGILWFGLNFTVSLIGGILYLFDKQYRIKGGVKLT